MELSFSAFQIHVEHWKNPLSDKDYIAFPLSENDMKIYDLEARNAGQGLSHEESH